MVLLTQLVDPALVTVSLLSLGNHCLALPVLEILQKSPHSQGKEWAEPQAWPIRILQPPHIVMDSRKSQWDGIMGMSTYLEFAGCECRVGGSFRGEGLPGHEAIMVETRVKSTEKPWHDDFAEPSTSPQHLQSWDPLNPLLVLELVGVEFLSLATSSSNSPHNDPCNCGLVS